MDIDSRKIKILQAIIDDYVTTAEPVGSRTIAKKYDLGISSATIRNEMADLEEMGYLEQLHSSSGRKPSNKGYRLYVDKLMLIPKLSLEEENLIRNKILNATMYEIDKIVKQATTLLSDLTKLTCIVRTPSVNKSSLKSLQLVSIDPLNVLAVIITDTGLIKNSIIKIQKPLLTEDLTKINNLLNYRLKGLTIEDINLKVINLIKSDLGDNDEIFNAMIPELYETLNGEDNNNVYSEGTTNIFNYPEYNDIDRAKQFLSLVDDEENIKKFLNTSGTISVKIGDENFVHGANECSVISATYSYGGKPIGTIGVIGPTRIPYSKVISILSKVIVELNGTIDQNFYDDR